MDFSYKDAFGTDPPEAYERLLLDAINGDPTLFIRTDEVEQAWRFSSRSRMPSWRVIPTSPTTARARGDR